MPSQTLTNNQIDTSQKDVVPIIGVISRPPMESTMSTTEIRMVNDPIYIEEIPEQQLPMKKMTLSNPSRNLYRLAACVFWSFSGGFSDATPGALLPHIEAYYGTSYAVTSCIWIGNALGFIFIAAISHKIQPWFGKRKSLVLGCASQTIMYALVSSGTKFPIIVIAFFFGGAGFATVLSQSNVFTARFDKASKYLSFLHGAYGVGATVSPILATVMVSRGIKWHFFYLLLLGLMIMNGIALFISFKGADEDLKKWDYDEPETIELQDRVERDSSESIVQEPSDMTLALKNKNTWLIAFFCLFYQGSEVSLAGWIVTFFLDYRKGNINTVGYAASGLWGGLTLGRLLLTRPLHIYLGARRGVIIVSIISIIMVALVWGIPNLFAEAVLVALAGIAIGPNYSLLIMYSASEGLLPRKIQVVSLTIMTAFGSSGGALFPFIVGLLSQKVGTFVVLPVFIALYSSMLIMWISLPNIEHRNRSSSKFKLLDRIW
ncbi:major facilitator superfamily domain-containing protein [Scheffersomyces amazonensis]|uniref:major facilitator superfamily domain-containing protein n=1 Tax=Scheffersomyces amazonensis TaxID=1078765 RepID=UPI00315D61EE